MKIVQGKYGEYELWAERNQKGKNWEMVDFVEMTCTVCGNRINYLVHNSCPDCGRIWIGCETPGCMVVEFSFGE